MIKLLVVDKKIGVIPKGVNYILNISGYDIDDPRQLDYKIKFRDLLEKTKQNYLEFIYQFSQKSGFIDRKINDVSLWWFSEIQHKDSWQDDFLRDLTVLQLIDGIGKELNIDQIQVCTDSLLINSHLGGKPKVEKLITLTYLYKRFKHLFKYLLVKLIYRTPHDNRKVKHCFLSYFPVLWCDFDGKPLDRNFKDQPHKLEDSWFALYIDKITKAVLTKNIPDKSLVVQSFVSFRFILGQCFNFRHYLWYLLNRRKIKELCKHNGIDLWPVFRKYISQTTLVNDYLYSVLIKGLSEIVSRYNPKDLISPGEFGLEAKATTVACSGTKTQSIWYQHTALTASKLWLFNYPKEITPLAISDSKKIYNKEQKNFMPLPDKILVWSEYYKQFLFQHSHYPPKRSLVVGSLKFSHLDTVNKVYTKNDHCRQKKYFFTPTLDEHEVRQFCYFISTLCKERVFSADQVTLKLHPASSRYFDINKIIAEYGNIYGIEIITSSAGLDNYIASIKCIIAGGTTIGIEAAFFGLPVIQYLPKYRLSLSPLDENLTVCVSDSNSLKQAIINVDKIKAIDYQVFFVNPELSRKLIVEALV